MPSQVKWSCLSWSGSLMRQPSPLKNRNSHALPYLALLSACACLCGLFCRRCVCGRSIQGYNHMREIHTTFLRWCRKWWQEWDRIYLQGPPLDYTTSWKRAGMLHLRFVRLLRKCFRSWMTQISCGNDKLYYHHSPLRSPVIPTSSISLTTSNSSIVRVLTQ